MKKIVLLAAMLFISVIHIFGITYYVSFLTGNDENSGTLPTTPWKTLGKINGYEFLPGDSILFKRGEIWRGQLISCSGAATGYVTYSSYGNMKVPKPIIMGSVRWNLPEKWENIQGNIWATVIRKTQSNSGSENELNVDVGNIIFNNGEKCGVKVWDETSLDLQGKFWYDVDNKVVKLYSSVNPAKFYDNIELALKHHIIDQGNKNYIKYENLDLRNGAAHGIGGGNVHHIIVKNCDLSFIGGALQAYNKNGKPVRYGNGIEFWGNAHDCYVINCKIGDVYDAAVTNQGGENVTQYNIFYRNNIIWNSEYSFEYWLRNNSTASNIFFENNTCVNAGNGWGHNQRPDGHNGRHLMFYDNQAEVDNFYICNNIFSESTESALRISKKWNGLTDLYLDHNLYFESSGNVADWQGISYSIEEFKKFQQDSGKDKFSIFADPNFIDKSKFDYHLRKGSPAIDAGVDTVNLKNSYNKPKKAGSHYDIGAYTYLKHEKLAK